MNTQNTRKRDPSDPSRNSREVVQSYIATTAMYDFNAYEKRILYNLVRLAQSQIEGVRLSENLYRIDHAYSDLVKVELPVSDFLTGEGDKHHARVKQALLSLHGKTFGYRDENVWECFSIISNPKIELRSSKVSFYVNTRVWDVLLDFSRGFSRYDLEVAFSLESPYAMRFYELLCCQESPITYSIESLRRIFRLEDKYATTKDFIRRVVESARRELDSKSPVTFTYRPVKEGRRFTHLQFFPVRQDRFASSRSCLKAGLRLHGISAILSSEECRCLEDIGFTESGIRANISLFMRCQKELDFPAELSLIRGRCRTKNNPCGWCIETLKGRINDLHRIR